MGSSNEHRKSNLKGLHTVSLMKKVKKFVDEIFIFPIFCSFAGSGISISNADPDPNPREQF